MLCPCADLTARLASQDGSVRLDGVGADNRLHCRRLICPQNGLRGTKSEKMREVQIAVMIAGPKAAGVVFCKARQHLDLQRGRASANTGWRDAVLDQVRPMLLDRPVPRFENELPEPCRR